MNINISELSKPITFDSLEKEAPEAFHELANMDIQRRGVLICWLNGRSTSPVGYGFADNEFTKEDATSSSLRTDEYVDFVTLKVSGSRCEHVMTPAMVNEFFNDREAMRTRVSNHVFAERMIDTDRRLNKAIKWRGAEWLKKRIDELATNDEVYQKKEQKEPKQ